MNTLYYTLGQALLRSALEHLLGMKKGDAQYAIVDSIFNTVVSTAASLAPAVAASGTVPALVSK